MRVFCHSGYAADERPLRFECGDAVYGVVQLLGQWRTPEDDYFKVLVSDGHLYVLRHCRARDEWTLENVNP